MTVLPDSLVDLRSKGRSRLVALRQSRMTREENERSSQWKRLVRVVEADLPADLFHYTDLAYLRQSLTSCQVLAWVTILLPDSWPVRCAYRRTPAPEGWLRDRLDGASAEDGGECWWLVAIREDLPGDRTLGASSLDVALALAEKSQDDQDDEREAFAGV